MRRAHGEQKGQTAKYCDGQCGGLAEYHSQDLWSLGENDEPVLSGCAGWECYPICVDWMVESSTVSDILKAYSWASNNQQLGFQEDLTLAISDGVMTIKEEWDRVFKEDRENK